MSAQHTPGPWEVSHAGEGAAGGKFQITEYYVRLPGADFALAADVVDADMKPSEANARLIAAAPELLECVQTALAALDAGVRVSPESFLHDRMRELIAKATGAQS